MSKFNNLKILLVGLATLCASSSPATAAPFLDVPGPTGSVADPTVRVTGDGGVFFSKGTSTSLPATITSGGGLLWYAPKSALILSENFAASPSPTGVGTNSLSIFSASRPTGSKAISIGSSSSDYTASGTNSLLIHKGYATGQEAVAINGGTASGTSSTSIGGVGGTASGHYSTTIGGGTVTASGIYSIALLGGTSSGAYSLAGALGTASNSRAIAFGMSAVASGVHSTAFGYSSSAVGQYATAIGNGTSSGQYAFSTNRSTYATGENSAAFGTSTTAQAYGSFAVGRYNTPAGDPLTWQETDPLFVVGNGTAENNPNDAFVIYKDGRIRIDKPQGDILMGEFD